QRAYEIYVTSGQRSPTDTARILNQELNLDIPHQRIFQWARVGDWQQRFMDEMERIFPETRKETAANLVMAGVMASRRLIAAFSGEKLERGEDKLIFGALDRAGFSPVGSRDPVASTSPQQVQQSSLIEKLLSPDEIAAIAAEAGGREPETVEDTPEIDDVSPDFAPDDAE